MTPNRDHYDLIWGSIWLGGHPACPGDVPDDFAVVAVGGLSFSSRHPGPRLEFQMDDEEGAVPPREELERIALWVDDQLSEGRQVLFHCLAGLNRSSLVLGYYLCSRKRLTGTQAIDWIRSRRMSTSGRTTPCSTRASARRSSGGSLVERSDGPLAASRPGPSPPRSCPCRQERRCRGLATLGAGSLRPARCRHRCRLASVTLPFAALPTRVSIPTFVKSQSAPSP